MYTARAKTVADVMVLWVGDSIASSGNVMTDGERLWSYGTLIGFTSNDGRKVVINRTAKSHCGFVSVTTSRHVNKAISTVKTAWPAALVVMHPVVFEKLGGAKLFSACPTLELGQKLE